MNNIEDIAQLQESLLTYKGALMKKMKELCVDAVKEELEFPGEMPDDLFEKFKNASNKEEMKNLLVKLVQLTKSNIINRINTVLQYTQEKITLFEFENFGLQIDLRHYNKEQI